MYALRDLPPDFGMALLQNTRAAAFFDNCSPAMQAAILGRVHNLNSKNEIRAFVSRLAKTPL